MQQTVILHGVAGPAMRSRNVLISARSKCAVAGCVSYVRPESNAVITAPKGKGKTKQTKNKTANLLRAQRLMAEPRREM